MTTAAHETELMEREAPMALTVVGDADIDSQVATAKRYPRSVTTFLRRAQELAALNPEVAKSCIYAIPRDGKIIEGPSARFAEAMAAAWGNLRAKGFNAGEDEHFITGAAVAWDIENNVAIGFEVKRRITGKGGRRYNDDMIGVTANAAASIALRNAILKVIPGAHWKPVYDHVRKVIAGTQQTFAARRDEMFKVFAVMGATEQRVCAILPNVKGKADVTLEHMVTLAGLYNALKEGETTLDEALPEVTAAAPRTEPGAGNGHSPSPAEHPAQPSASASSASAPIPPPATPAAQAPAQGAGPVLSLPEGFASVVGRITTLTRKNGRHTAVLNTGLKLATEDANVQRAVDAAEAAQADFLFVYKPASDPARFASKLLEVRNPDAK